MSRRLGACVAAGLLLVAAGVLPAVAKTGKAATAFVLDDVNGKKFDLAPHLKKDVVLVNFFATWCAPCMAELPVLQSLHEKYADQGLQIVVISVDDAKSKAKVKPLVREQGLTFPVLLDTKSAVTPIYLPKKTVPYTVIIDRAGNIVSEKRGYQPGEEVELEKKLQALLAAKSDAPAGVSAGEEKSTDVLAPAKVE